MVLEFTQRAADVYSYIKDIAPIVGLPIVSGATAWDDPEIKWSDWEPAASDPQLRVLLQLKGLYPQYRILTHTLNQKQGQWLQTNIILIQIPAAWARNL